MLIVIRFFLFLLIVGWLTACGAAEKNILFNGCKIDIPNTFVEVKNGLSKAEYLRQDLYSLSLIQLNETPEDLSDRLKEPDFENLLKVESNNLVFWRYELVHPNPDVKISAILVDEGNETLKLQSNNMDELVPLIESCFDNEVLQALRNAK